MTSEELIRQGKDYRNKRLFNEAYKCFLEAALSDNPVAIKSLGRCYLHGEGVPQNYDKASYYFDLAEDMSCRDKSGHDDGENYRDDDRRYNFTVGLEPMRINAFKYMVEDILRTITYGEDYLSVAYCPVREDGISCVQSHPQENDDLHYVEIVIKDDGKRGFKIFAKEALSLFETIAVYEKVLIDYEMPSLIGWEDVTEKVKYDE